MLHSKHDLVQVDSQDTLGESEQLMQQGLEMVHKGQLDQAVSLFEQSLSIDPNHAAAHNNLGIIHYRQRKLVPAASHFDTASQLLPDDPRPINGLAMTLECGGRFYEAIELYERAVRARTEQSVVSRQSCARTDSHW